MFKASIGNIDSHQEVVIVVGYVTELQFSADQVVYTFLHLPFHLFYFSPFFVYVSIYI